MFDSGRHRDGFDLPAGQWLRQSRCSGTHGAGWSGQGKEKEESNRNGKGRLQPADGILFPG
jgi:hypothetical protein